MTDSLNENAIRAWQAAKGVQGVSVEKKTAQYGAFIPVYLNVLISSLGLK